MQFFVGSRQIGDGAPAYLIAEISANHGGSFERALETVRAIKEAGADAVKIQTYTPDTITLDCRSDMFQIQGTLWEGRNLYDLYAEAMTPWEWHEPLKQEAEKLGLDFFSTAFDPTAVDFLEQLGVPVHKIASFELVDIPLIQKMAATGKPLIMSTGMATLEEIEEAVGAARGVGATEIALLRCNSAYPAELSEMNLASIPTMRQKFGVPVGLSDHTLGTAAASVAVTLGASIIEKHFTLSRADTGPDAAFSLEPAEFRAMADAVRATEQMVGQAQFGPTEHERASLRFRRSLFVVADVKADETLGENNVRSIRPANGLAPKYWGQVEGKKAARDLKRGEALAWDMIAETL
jgi:N-acetylneuraminate synthase